MSVAGLGLQIDSIGAPPARRRGEDLIQNGSSPETFDAILAEGAQIEMAPDADLSPPLELNDAVSGLPRAVVSTTGTIGADARGLAADLLRVAANGSVDSGADPSGAALAPPGVVPAAAHLQKETARDPSAPALPANEERARSEALEGEPQSLLTARNAEPERAKSKQPDPPSNGLNSHDGAPRSIGAALRRDLVPCETRSKRDNDKRLASGREGGVYLDADPGMAVAKPLQLTQISTPILSCDSPSQAGVAEAFAVTPEASPPSAQEPGRDAASGDLARIDAVLATRQSAPLPTRIDEKAEGAVIGDVNAPRADVRVAELKSWFAPVEDDALKRHDDGRDRIATAEPLGIEAQPAPRASATTRDDVLTTSQNDIVATPDLMAGPAPRQQNNSPEAFVAPKASAASPAAIDAPAPSMAIRRDLQVTLEPHELGGLAVRLKSVGDRLTIAFVAEKHDTTRLIGDRSQALESQLRDAGLGLGGMEISVAVKPESGVSGDAGASASGAFEGGARDEPRAAPQRQERTGRNGEEVKDETSDKAADLRRRRSDRGLYL